jgi:hypothetical protein
MPASLANKANVIYRHDFNFVDFSNKDEVIYWCDMMCPSCAALHSSYSYHLNNNVHAIIHIRDTLNIQ